MIGHKGHPEVEGTMGQLREGIYLVEDADDVAQRAAARRQAGGGDADHAERGRRGRDPGRGEAPASRTCASRSKQDICYATQNRQDAVKVLAPQRRRGHRRRQPDQQQQQPAARAVAAPGHAGLHGRCGRPTCMPQWFEGRRRVGLTAGASAPDILVQQVIERLRELGAVSVRRLPGVQEDVDFPLPLGLGDRSMAELDCHGPESRTQRDRRRRKPLIETPHARHQPAAPRPRPGGRPAADAQDAAALPGRGALRRARGRAQGAADARRGTAGPAQQPVSKQIGQLKAKGQDSAAPMAEVARIADEPERRRRARWSTSRPS